MRETDGIGWSWSGDDKSIRVHRRISLMKVTVGPVANSAMTQSFQLVVTDAHVCCYMDYVLKYFTSESKF